MMRGQHLLGLGALLLTVVPGYVVSRISAREVVPTPSAPAIPDDLRDPVGRIVDDIVESTPASAGIDAHIRDVAIRYSVSETLIAAIIEAESGFDARAVSRRGALGLMQLMPATAATLGVLDPFDPRKNIEGGVRHLRAMMARFPDNLPLALAAYNAGERAVIRHRGMPPYRETRQYVHRILGQLRSDRSTTARYDAAYTLPPVARLVAGETVTVVLQVTNTGTASWNNVGPCAVVLGDHWYQGGRRLVSETQAAPLPAPVPPGQTVELEASLSVPSAPGTYMLAWDMRAHCQWFTNLGGAARRQRVEVISMH